MCPIPTGEQGDGGDAGVGEGVDLREMTMKYLLFLLAALSRRLTAQEIFFCVLCPVETCLQRQITKI